ncbi:MAG TPA: penicillin acylase family protein [Steroidobacteraceae bacterium]|nr:penicillin acylase family protein [Steroidobacteraceae bacterium]
MGKSRAHGGARITMKRLFRIAGIAAGALAALCLLSAVGGWLMLRASLPVLEGRVQLRGIASPVTVERDAAGVPTVRARDRDDAAFGLGYLHGQDRFFQMDLLRRAAAGELSALLGPSLLAADRKLRVHRFRAAAHAAVAALDAPSRRLLDAYVSGVNAGLSSLGARPFEYWLLRSRPKAWSAEDSVLCIHAMFLQLQDSTGHLQLQRGLLRATLPQGVWRFLEAGAPEWDAAIDGSSSTSPEIPDRSEFDLRSLKGLSVYPPVEVENAADTGSNNWAVAGSRTADGSAVLANDMHLGFRVPNIWYRARLIDAAGLDVIGVTLPGTPSIVAGSNRHIAWGFTNSYGEFERVVRLVPVPGEPGAYATASGPQRLRYLDETIEVKGAAAEHLSIALTAWGPVMGTDWENRPYALNWTAHDPAAVNLKLIALEQARSAAEALRAAGSFGIPGQNLLVADRDGHIGWTIAGRLPLRGDAPPGVPQLSTDPQVGFPGWLAAQAQPQVLDPIGGLLWSANARVVGGAQALLIGDDGMDRGARAAQIRSDLESASKPFTARASLGIALDARADFLARWKTLLSAVIERARAQGDHRQDAARAVLARWSGSAAPDDPAYRLTYQFRREVEARAFYMLIAPARLKAMGFQFEIPPSFEGPLWRLLSLRPAHLLARQYASWDGFLLEALIASEALPPGCVDLSACTWGTVNAVRIAHPLGALPMLGDFLDMPVVRIPGGRHDMPRIQGPDYGASERFSVSPGHEEQGYFHMPGGQSGHPLSPFYRAGFSAWAEGRPTPLLPGATAYRLVLTP